MDESKEEISIQHGKKVLNPFAIKKPKKRSLVERELETNMTARVTSPASVEDGVSTSRYGRARRSKGSDRNDFETLKSPKSENTPIKIQSPVIKQVVSSTFKVETPKKALETSLDNIDNTYQASKSSPSAKKFTKVYIRKDLIQNRDDDDDIILIKDLFSPKSGKKNNIKHTSSEKFKSNFSKQNGHIELSSVVKALDFDGNKKDSTGNKQDASSNKRDYCGNKRDYSSNKKHVSSNKKDVPNSKRDSNQSKKIKENDLKLEWEPELKGESCPYQEGDLAWARMGTFPFWPCIITRDPESKMYARRKLFGRVEHYILHVTFFADNGRRSWVVDNMLRKYMGLEEFLSAREKFTPEDRKNNQRLYSAFFISEKKQSLWNTSVVEAEMINREPKNLRIDIFNDLLHKARASKKQLRSGRVTRTDSDVSLSESLYDSLFSEDDGKADDSTRSRNKSRNKSLDVSDVVTACLDNMAAKTGNIKIQRQSHMDRWLQKAKSKTPEKVKVEQAAPKTPIITPKVEIVTPTKVTPQTDKIYIPKVDKVPAKLDKSVSNKKKKLPSRETKITKVYSLRRSYESQNALVAQTENEVEEIQVNLDISTRIKKDFEIKDPNDCPKEEPTLDLNKEKSLDDLAVDSSDDKIELLKEITDTCSNAKLEQLKMTCKENDNDDILNAIDELLGDTSTAENVDKTPNPHDVIHESSDEKEVAKKPQNVEQDIKPEVMDVDDNQENKVKESAAITEVVPDSPIKNENDSSKSNILKDGPVEIVKSSTENNLTVVPDEKNKEGEIEVKITSSSKSLTIPDVKSKQDDTEMISKSTNDLDQTTLQSSPSLKCNEMVSIPDNSNMTDDDESNTMTSIQYNTDITDRQDHNSNLTNVNTKTKGDIVKLTGKEVNDITTDISTEKQDIDIKERDMSTVTPDIETKNPVLLIENNDMSIDEMEVENILMDKKDLLNESGQSESILHIDDNLNEGDNPKLVEERTSVSLNSNANSESILETCKNSALELNPVEMKVDEYKATSTIEPNPFLGNSSNIDVYKDSAAKEVFFREVNMNKPPDLTIASKADILLNGQIVDSDYEDSDDEPSPEFEPLGDEITEDFRQHMKCIESSITDKKDDAQLVKVCNEIAIIEESKAKLDDIKIIMNKTNLNPSIVEHEEGLKIIKEGSIKTEDEFQTINRESKKVLYEETINMDLKKTLDDSTEDTKSELQDGINIINKAAEYSLKSPLDKKKSKLSLKKDKSQSQARIVTDQLVSDNNINLRYKTIDQIEEIMKNKPKRLPIENGEVSIPNIKENGYHPRIDTPDHYDDDDFDIDEASVNSEDSEVSLPHEKIPARRSLRSRPVKKGGLEDPEFLTYMELRQDDLMEQHPELSLDDIVLYLYKTYTYTQNLNSDVKIEESPIVIKSLKQETPPSRKNSKKVTQPKTTIENFFREKYKKAMKTEFDSETSDSNDYVKTKKELSVSPIDSDSGIGSKDSNESDASIKRKNKSKSPQTHQEVTKDVKIELINEDTEQAVSPKTPKRLRRKTFSPRVLDTSNSKTSPKVPDNSLDKRWPVVVISPIKDKYIEITHKHETTKDRHVTGSKFKHNAEKKHEPIKAKLDSIEPKLEIINTKIEPEDDAECEENTKLLAQETESKNEPRIGTKQGRDNETESIDSDSELPLRQLRSKVIQENELKTEMLDLKIEIQDTASVSSDNEPLLRLRPKKIDKSIEGSYEDPEFLKYLELNQDNIMDENPLLSQNEIKAYLYKTWIYEKDSKNDIQKNDDIASSNLVKGLNHESVPTRKKRKPKTEKQIDPEEIISKEKPRRKTVSHYYNEAFLSDIEDELEVFEIFKTKNKPINVVAKQDSPKKEAVDTETNETVNNEIEDNCEEINTIDEIELYFKKLTSTKPSVFKGLIREKVCAICEDISNLIKCKGCNGSFHYDCVKKVVEIPETPAIFKGRKKKKKTGRKPKNHDDSDHSDEQNVSEENISMEEISETINIDAATIESQLEAKMKELLEKNSQFNYDSYSSDDGIDWTDTIPGKCELVDVKLKRRTPPIDYTNFKCNNCQKYDTPVCFVCKSDVSKTNEKIRQKCNVAHCYSYYHLECLTHWPQTQFNAGELSRNNKKASEKLEALTCPRHVCHTCVSDDPRGCKTRFSGDKLAKCVRCPATYHSFNKCLPAGTQILTASFIICPRHYEHRSEKVPCHVNTGWCFICALGGSLICCEYCPTSFHAECLNIKPPEGNYMCEDCETGRLPLYGEMVWVKLGHYRWWPGVVLHPSEIPDNIMAVKHELGEFVVRFFGQYDHYWVNRGRVFPYQEGDSGRISSRKSKIDVAFTTAMEHAQRAFEILKNTSPDEEESMDIASSLLPPHYVRLKCNKPIGSLLGRKMEDPSLSLTQCECNPAEDEPCGPNSQCINRMLLTECGPTCRAGDRCNNRAFEKRLYPKLTPYRATHRGWGLKTLEDIKAGQFVIEYVGELIDEEEFQRRMARKHEIRDENFYFLILDKERMIDAGPKGNLARFMNHCCEPNCETQKWTVLGDVRVGLFAIDDIKANSEVTFNYNLECTGIEKKRCLCGAKRCSGYIGAKPKQLEESHRKRNRNLAAKEKYTKRKIKMKRPVGRPRKPKELTEIEKDLLIIKSATLSDSPDEKTLKPSKKKTNSNTSDEVSNSSEHKTSKAVESGNKDSNTKEEESIHSGIEHKEAKTLKRELDLNSIDEVTISSEPSAKRIKCEVNNCDWW